MCPASGNRGVHTQIGLREKLLVGTSPRARGGRGDRRAPPTRRFGENCAVVNLKNANNLAAGLFCRLDHNMFMHNYPMGFGLRIHHDFQALTP